MKYCIVILVLCFGCNDQKPYEVKVTNYDSLLSMSRETKLMLDTQLMVAKFNYLEINAIAGMIKHRGKDRDSFFYYVGKADAFTEGRETIYK